ncbi:MAG: hypothetical protein LBU67_05410 [Oscillospiraceae bacterium]|jgi:hypothetical protein|nr:hypothetical protein [Oscillospiraceae bacterium]
MGTTASALTEILDMLPQGMECPNLGDDLHRLAWVLVLGKPDGALAAGTWG